MLEFLVKSFIKDQEIQTHLCSSNSEVEDATKRGQSAVMTAIIGKAVSSHVVWPSVLAGVLFRVIGVHNGRVKLNGFRRRLRRMEKLQSISAMGKSSNIGLTFAPIHCASFFPVRRTAHIPPMGLLYGHAVLLYELYRYTKCSRRILIWNIPLCIFLIKSYSKLRGYYNVFRAEATVMVHSCVAAVGRGRLASAANALSVASDPTQLPPALPSPVLCDEGPERCACSFSIHASDGEFLTRNKRRTTVDVLRTLAASLHKFIN